MTRTGLRILAIAALSVITFSAEARPRFIAVYVPQFLTTDMASTQSGTAIINGPMQSPLIGFQFEGFTGSYYIEGDASGDIAAIMGLAADQMQTVDGGMLDCGFGFPVFGENPTIGLGGSLDIHMLSNLRLGGWSGLGAFVFAVVDIGKTIYIMPKVKYTMTGFDKSTDEISNSIDLDCNIGLRFAGPLGISVQPTYAIRNLAQGGTANRMGLRLGVGLMY